MDWAEHQGIELEAGEAAPFIPRGCALDLWRGANPHRAGIGVNLTFAQHLFDRAAEVQLAVVMQFHSSSQVIVDAAHGVGQGNPVLGAHKQESRRNTKDIGDSIKRVEVWISCNFATL